MQFKRLLFSMVLSAWLGAVTRAADDPPLVAQLRIDVDTLAADIGPRSVFQGKSMSQAGKYIAGELNRAGWKIRAEVYLVKKNKCVNVVAERTGTTKPDEIVIVGAHYDTVPITPGADDNASGVAVLLALARELSGAQPERTLRLVAFANEEPIYFQTEFMGSRVHARGCKKRGEKIVAMLSLECLGYYTEAKNSQKYPFSPHKSYSQTGNFLAVVGNRESKALVDQVKHSLEISQAIPSESIAMSDSTPGIGWSDHWSFWQEGYEAVMLTDTALNRNPNYHRATDVAATLNFEKMAAATRGIVAVVQDLVKR